MAEQEKTSVVPGELGSFLFWANSPSGTYSELEAKRAAIAHLMAKQKGFPKNLGEGLTYLGESIGEAGLRARLEAAEAAYRKREEAAGRAPPGEKTYINTDGTPVVPAARSEAAPTARPVKTTGYRIDPTTGQPVEKTPAPPPPAAAAPPVRPLSFTQTSEPDATVIPTPNAPPGLSTDPNYFGGNPFTPASVTPNTDDAANVLTPIEPGMPIRGDRPEISPNERVRQGFEEGPPPSGNLMFDPRQQGDVPPIMKSPASEELTPYFATGGRPGPQSSVPTQRLPESDFNFIDAAAGQPLPGSPGYAAARNASVRTNNPGAQVPTDISRTFGQTGQQTLGRPGGQGQPIAEFPTPTHGAAANFSNLAKNYVGMPIGAAISKWSGGGRNTVPGYDPRQVITPEMARDPQFAVPFMKAIAGGEATGRYPMTDEQWQMAHQWATKGGLPPEANPRGPGVPAQPPVQVAGDQALSFTGEPTEGLPSLPPQGDARSAITDLIAKRGGIPGDRSGMGGLSGSVEASRSFQPYTAPEVPPVNPTLPGTPSPATTSTPPTSAGAPGSNVVAQAPTVSDIPAAPPAPALPPGVGSRLGGSGVLQGGASAAGPGGIQAQGGGTLPSQEGVPPQPTAEMPDPGPAPPPPKMLGLSEKQQRLQKIINDRGLDPRFRQQAHDEFQLEEKFRTAIEQRQQEAYKDQRELWQKKREAKDKWELEREVRGMTHQKTRLEIQRQIAEANMDPDKALQLRKQIDALDIDIAQKAHNLRLGQTYDEQKLKDEAAERAQKLAAGQAPDTKIIEGSLLQWNKNTRTWDDVTPGIEPGKIKMTEAQAKAVDMLTRSIVYHNQIGNADVLAGLTNTLAGKVPIGGNYWTSADYQRKKSAADAWLLATVRHESGAVINRDEIPQFYPVYFGIPGDNADTLRDKEQRREAAMRGQYEALGTARPIIDRFMETRKERRTTEPEGTQQRNVKTGKTRTVRNGYWEDDLFGE